jgi:hypothetical protein
MNYGMSAWGQIDPLEKDGGKWPPAVDTCLEDGGECYERERERERERAKTVPSGLDSFPQEVFF